MPSQRKSIDFICHPDGTVERCIPKEPSFQDSYRNTQNQNNQKTNSKITCTQTKGNNHDIPYWLIYVLFFILGIFRVIESQGNSKINKDFLDNFNRKPQYQNSEINNIENNQINSFHSEQFLISKTLNETKNRLNICECFVFEFQEKEFNKSLSNQNKAKQSFYKMILDFLDETECNLFSIDNILDSDEQFEESLYFKKWISDLRVVSK